MWRSVDDLAIIDIGLSEVFDWGVRSVSMLDGTWGHAAQGGIHAVLEEIQTSMNFPKTKKPNWSETLALEGGTKLCRDATNHYINLTMRFKKCSSTWTTRFKSNFREYSSTNASA